MRVNDRTCLYDQQQLANVLDGMAGRLLGLLDGRSDVVLIGILRRGVPLASLLAERLLRLGVPPAQRLQLEVKRYGDDLTLLYPQTLLRENPAETAVDLSGKTVVVVDDVLYRGHSLLRVAQFLALRGAAEIRSMVLVDRGVSLLPVHADVTGVRLQVAPGSIIEVHVPPYENDFCIELVRHDAPHDP
ncbi:MAG TPA: phosphoribosyltransferase family protein [Accumulibacter sp.]|uniref:Phosphoribosyltransferase n=1 Tax=Candidatus Accumulibacter cognatus TaxID=2954383 RepID=A0A7D5SG30_9PROT|nr:MULTISPECIES: phosphoribosyltransferase family protein [Candidatus Accumulibacter]MBN8516595.1 phosphoribosyltransferase domain-containing protein [Accumulibacter sp.]MBO3710228.1 phosphoribosyltransferase domain-containing protein [Accumulibacter sp.]MCC2867973.1 phosphoribosyltransferase domain-containing protein [Candidatus Accumulibacter phosphatis]MCM8581182.1 phosphoribosyltransferase domain-containing protein [Accumulibacter sp.]MCM8620543.1 phosphoribosyltransferase domain-containin